MIPRFHNSDLQRLAEIIERRLRDGNAVTFTPNRSNSTIHIDEFIFHYTSPYDLQEDCDLFRLWKEDFAYGFHAGDTICVNSGCIPNGNYVIERSDQGELIAYDENDDNSCSCHSNWVVLHCPHSFSSKSNQLSILEYDLPKEETKPQEAVKPI